jgi:hypothetical protein
MKGREEEKNSRKENLAQTELETRLKVLDVKFA